MLSIDYQNHQIQKIKVINKTGHPAIEQDKINSQLLTNLTPLSHNSSLPTIGRDRYEHRALKEAVPVHFIDTPKVKPALEPEAK
jgi:hypothetical protein